MIELLVVVSIISVVSAVILPAVFKSWRQGKIAAEIENLRQIGIAASLYAESTDRIALGVLDFHDTKIWRSTLWSSPLDPKRQGFRNWFLERLGERDRHYNDLIVDFKSSFLTFGDLLSQDPTLRRTILESPGAGWLVSFCSNDLEALPQATWVFRLGFRRLNFDGSVVTRPSQRIPQGFGAPWVFFDQTPQGKSLDLQ